MPTVKNSPTFSGFQDMGKHLVLGQELPIHTPVSTADVNLFCGEAAEIFKKFREVMTTS